MSATIYALGNAVLGGQTASYSFSKTLTTADVLFRQEFKDVTTTPLVAFSVGTEAGGTVADFTHAIIYNRDTANALLVEFYDGSSSTERVRVTVPAGCWFVLPSKTIQVSTDDGGTWDPRTITKVRLLASSTTVTWVQVIVYGIGS